MTYDINTYELILQNNSTTEIRFYTLNDLAESYKYHQFEMDTNNIYIRYNSCCRIIKYSNILHILYSPVPKEIYTPYTLTIYLMY